MIIPESKINISLIGEDGAVLTDDAYASKKNCFGEEMSTSGSSTVYIYAPDFMPKILHLPIRPEELGRLLLVL